MIQSLVGPVCENWDPPVRAPTCDSSRVLRTALRDENCRVAIQSPSSIAAKLTKLADGSPFVFFRGTAAFFYANLFCYGNEVLISKDAGMIPQVVSNGDCHPENFGLMEGINHDNLLWGVNDFDQSFHAPFTYDLTRGATGFAVACMTRHNLSEKKRKDTREIRAVADECDSFVNDFISSYVDVVQHSDQLTLNDMFVSGSSLLHKFSMVDQLFVDTAKMSSPVAQRAWFQKKGIDLKTEKFVPSAKLDPLPSNSIRLWQAAVDQYVFHGPKELARTGNTDPRNYFKVLDVARKKGSGTGSVGLQRYWILVQGHTSQDPLDDRVIEFKQETDSVLERYMGLKVSTQLEGQRVAEGEQLAYPYTNLFYSWANAMHKSFVVRGRSFYKTDVDLSTLSLTSQSFGMYARACGRALALYHMRVSCPTPECSPLSLHVDLDHDVAKNIQNYLKHVGGIREFSSNVIQFALEEAVRTVRGHSMLLSEVDYARQHKVGICNVTLSSN